MVQPTNTVEGWRAELFDLDRNDTITSIEKDLLVQKFNEFENIDHIDPVTPLWRAEEKTGIDVDSFNIYTSYKDVNSDTEWVIEDHTSDHVTQGSGKDKALEMMADLTRIIDEDDDEDLIEHYDSDLPTQEEFREDLGIGLDKRQDEAIDAFGEDDGSESDTVDIDGLLVKRQIVNGKERRVYTNGSKHFSAYIDGGCVYIGRDDSEEAALYAAGLK